MASLQDLPTEVLLRIAEYAVHSSPKATIRQHAHGAEYVNTNVGGINRCMREAFLDTIRMHYVSVDMRFYQDLPYFRDDELQERLDYYFKCSKAAALMMAMKT